MKTALVTGGNRGLGFETCRILANSGFKVLLTCRDSAKGEKTAQELQDEGLDVQFFPLDVSDPQAVQASFQFVTKEWGRLDVLINNAGVFLDDRGRTDPTSKGPLHTSLAHFENTLKINVEGPFLMCQTFIPLMLKNGYGRIVNVSSQMGQLSSMHSDAPAYRISKAALNAVTCVFADEVREKNVLVNSVCPGWVKTDMGGPHASLTIAEGCDTIIWAATLPNGGPSGKFFQDRQLLPW